MDYQRACACRGSGLSNPAPQPRQYAVRSVPKQRERRFGCGCTPADAYAPNHYEYPSLAMVYAPYQKFDCLYDPADALKNATLFKQLNQPFLAGRKGGR